MAVQDKKNIGISGPMHKKLTELKDLIPFSNMQDGYRLAASLAIKRKLQVEDRELLEYQNQYDSAGLDNEGAFKNAINILYPNQDGKEYNYLEKLADAGVELLYQYYEEDGFLDFNKIINNET